MWKITKQSGRISKITKGQYEIDGFIIIPNVSCLSSITIKENTLSFNNTEFIDTITVYFISVGDLERFLSGFMRDSKIDSILKTDKK